MFSGISLFFPKDYKKQEVRFMINYRNSKKLGYLFVIPLCVFVFVFMVYPIIYNIQNSFHDWNGIEVEKTFIGLQNYIELFRDPIFKTVLKNFALFAVFTVGAQCVLGLLIANLFRKKFFGRDIAKAIVFMPAVLSSVIIGQIFFRIMDPNVGYLNSFFKAVGLDFLAGAWLSDPKTAFFVIIIINIWQWTGYSVTLYYGAMMGISNDMYEAAKSDGASGFQILKSITIPLVRGTTYNLTIIGVIGALKQYDLVAVMTAGGPANSTQTFASYMYQASFGTYRQGYASAIAVVMFIIAMIITIIQLRMYNSKTLY